MRSFDNIAKLIKERRTAHVKNYSQVELSSMLGYKNGQFISNVERGLCSIPLKMLGKVSLILDIPFAELSETLLKDYAATVENYIQGSTSTNIETVLATQSNSEEDTNQL